MGPLPLREMDDLRYLRSQGVTHVIDMVEPWEREPGFLAYTPVTAEDWENAGIELYRWEWADNQPLFPPSTLHMMVAKIWRLTRDEKARFYIHCRAGIGRSASLVVAYMMHTELLQFTDAYANLRNMRNQVNLNYAQQYALLAYGDWLEMKNRIDALEPTDETDLDAFVIVE